MREARGSVTRTGLASLAVGAAVFYCIYRVVSKARKKEGAAAAPEKGRPKGRRGAPDSSEKRDEVAGQGGFLLSQVSNIPVVSGTLRRDSDSPGEGAMDLPDSSGDLKVYDIENLIRLLESTEDPSVQEQILITLSNSAAFSVNQDIIRRLGGLSVVGEMLYVPLTNVKEKALNALNNLSMNIENQEVLKVNIPRVCEETDSSPLNSELQLAGLRFLTNMSVTSNYHDEMTSSIPCFLYLLWKGNERTQGEEPHIQSISSRTPSFWFRVVMDQYHKMAIDNNVQKAMFSTVQVLKVLVNLSANPATTKDFLNVQAPFLLSLFDSCTNKDVLLRVLMFATNLTKNMKMDKNTTAGQYNKDTIFNLLWGNSTLCAQKLATLLYHQDTEIREQVAELIMQQG